MDEATKYLLGQGILGIVCLVEGWTIFRLWRDNRVLSERLEAKSDKQAEKNQELAKQVVDAFQAATRSRGRRNTRALPGGES